ncbi:hypothetical protein EJF18_11214 [Clavispora lusitaniae]|uniref:Uncharacterized protein n=2 Tax=Clavispora lusitaniae TaxID=36911 RepID=A0ACD0WEZ2_CLALS|nr:hypothetical protein E0198_000002 [Clavispora lusitaniae]KAF7585051.1 hypothetical protein FOB63_001123 [Clavispora lusitaniae]OVF08307.1 hypothetical protein A9F13_09g02519 [Clavispora lusitaniae]QFZ26087.1 hypothetical protein EJF14_11214 [Clavispora lusitaniae]QFZ30610.1 hypothetical protein EJF16_11214 [Clavispora lusitaniae]
MLSRLNPLHRSKPKKRPEHHKQPSFFGLWRRSSTSSLPQAPRSAPKVVTRAQLIKVDVSSPRPISHAESPQQKIRPKSHLQPHATLPPKNTLDVDLQLSHTDASSMMSRLSHFSYQ